MHARTRSKQRIKTAMIAVLAAISAGCHSAQLPNARGRVSQDLSQRFGNGLTQPPSCGQSILPPSVVLDDGLTEDEATQIAVWNNAAFQDLLADLGISRAQLLDAGLIADPQMIIFFPLGPKQLEFAFFETLNSIWLRKLRVRIASMDLNQVSESMVQNGSNTIRDARVAHANLVQAQQQARVAREAESIRRQIAELARKRLADGDIGELEVTTAQIDALQAKATAARADQDVLLAQHRLRTVLGLTMLDAPLIAVDDEPAAGAGQEIVGDAEQLVHTALAMRPDLRAAEIGFEASCQRIGLAKGNIAIIDGVYDANGAGLEGFESGPGLRTTLPIFNGNRGGIAIAKAAWQKAARQYVTVRDQITLDVRTAYTQLVQARENLQLVQREILPALQEAQQLAQSNYDDGAVTYFFVLQTTGPYLDALNRESLLVGDVRRAIAELERSVGTRLTKSVPDSETPVKRLSDPDELLESEPLQVQ